MVEWFILPSANGAAIIQPRASPESARGVALGKTRKKISKAPTGRNNRRGDPKDPAFLSSTVCLNKPRPEGALLNSFHGATSQRIQCSVAGVKQSAGWSTH